MRGGKFALPGDGVCCDRSSTQPAWQCPASHPQHAIPWATACSSTVLQMLWLTQLSPSVLLLALLKSQQEAFLWACMQGQPGA